MRPTLCWADLAGRAVGIYGLGREGEANLRACLALGLDPVLVDDAGVRTQVDGRPLLRTDDGGLEALAACDVVIKSPGISRYGEHVVLLQDKGIPVVGGLGLWLQGTDRTKVVTFTGTKGKSTTTAITAHLLTGLGHRAQVGGNIGVPPYDPLLAGDEPDYWVVEVSSYQATDLASTPPVCGVTSLDPDHLPWHRGDAETYFRDKLSATSQPGADLTIANGDSERVLTRRDQLGPRVDWVHADDDPAADWMAPLGLLGTHNRRNALIAAAAVRALGVAAADDALRAAAAGFAPLANRLELIGSVGDVLFVDDGLSTNVLPTLAAVEAFPDRRIALIVGGQDRGIDYRPLAEGLRARSADLLLITVPDNGPAIHRAVTETGAGPRVTVVEAADLAAAVVDGHRWARPDGVVLLSPAAASFGRFRDYRERSEAFATAMRSLG